MAAAHEGRDLVVDLLLQNGADADHQTPADGCTALHWAALGGHLETLKILLGKGATLSGRLLLYDALNMRFRELKLRRDPEARPITELIDYVQFCGVPANDHDTDQQESAVFQSIDVKTAKARLDEGWAPYVLDVRKPNEAAIAKLAFADRLEPHETVANIAEELPRDRDILVHCKMGGRSAKACEALIGAGFDPSRIHNLEGGITGWAKEIDPSIPVY